MATKSNSNCKNGCSDGRNMLNCPKFPNDCPIVAIEDGNYVFLEKRNK